MQAEIDHRLATHFHPSALPAQIAEVGQTEGRSQGKLLRISVPSRLRPDSRLPGPRPSGRKFASSFTMGKSLIILILILVLSISTRTLALSTGTTGAFSETMDVIDVDDDQDMIHMNEVR